MAQRAGKAGIRRQAVATARRMLSRASGRIPAELGAIWAAGRSGGRVGYAGEEGQRMVMTTESVSASQEWSIPGPHAA
jgi:hypothetical protein